MELVPPWGDLLAARRAYRSPVAQGSALWGSFLIRPGSGGLGHPGWPRNSVRMAYQ
jgi:hypothetical protein